jgi:oligopeptide transport system substrate-binding protein
MSGPRNGGTFRIDAASYVSVDPAIDADWPEIASCALLMRYPDMLLPEGDRAVPEVAAGYPSVSRDARTYVFRIRSSFRFSNGARVTAANFAYMIDRVLSPTLKSPYGGFLEDIIGARAVEDGKAKHVSGVRASGHTLSIRLTRPIGDFVVRLTFPAFCPVPTSVPIVPDGVDVPLPGSGPYYIAKWTRDHEVVLKRNRFYLGGRPHHVAKFVVTIGKDDDDSITRKIDRSQTDYGYGSPGAVPTQAAGDLARKYGVKGPRFFVRPGGSAIFFLALNTSRPLFRNNPSLRRAVNFALDRPALVRARGPYWGTPSDGYLPLGMAGAPAGHVYPVRRPDLSRARALARGHTRSGTAILYTSDTPFATVQARIVQRNLKAIGLHVTIEQFPSLVLFQKTGTRGEPFDITLQGLSAEWVDPYWYINVLLDGRTITKYDNFNVSYLNVPRYNRQMERAARLTGVSRYRAYRRLALVLARDAAPEAVFATPNLRLFVSKRVGCVISNGYPVGLDLAAACLK